MYLTRKAICDVNIIALNIKEIFYINSRNLLYYLTTLNSSNKKHKVLYTWDINNNVLRFPSVIDLVPFFESLVRSIQNCQISYFLVELAKHAWIA